MKKNLGLLDKQIRVLLAIILAGLQLANVVTGLLGYICLAAAGILILTTLINFCPLYKIFGWNTNK